LWKSGRSQTAYLIVDTETAAVVSVWGVNESGDNVATSVIRPALGDEFRPTWRFIDETGEVVLVPTDDVLTFSREPFTYYYVPAYSGDYELTILVEDVAGNVSLDTVPLTVDNEDLDTDYRGFKDVSFGINFLYPWVWTDPTVIEDEEGGLTLNVSDETGEINIYIEAYSVETLDELLEIKLDEFSYLDDFAAKDPETVDLNGYESYYVDYTYTDDGNLVEGWLVLVPVLENSLAYSLDLDAPEERLDEADAVFGTMLNSLTFFEPYTD
ncbi:MAG TPA: hypothetical protein VHO69_03965, partial [Phototrophicaceae bacterium]|nr:hypothetical protein [Phototrophicaceae bacterium]